jgi:hypothetical protein
MTQFARRFNVLAAAVMLFSLIGGLPATDRAGRVILTDTQPHSLNAASCQWTYYPISGGQLQPEQSLFNDPANTPISDLSLGNPFKGKATSLATTGSTDFNGDGKTDVFRTYLRGDGSRQWQYSSGGTGAWQDLAYADGSLPASQLQFGNFNGDLKTDVFANSYLFPNYSWLYSPGGTDSFVTLRTTKDYANRLALGDFNGDGVTDVFTANLQSDSFYHWGYFPSGSGNLVPLAYAAADPALLHFGDFNGDGKTDVFAATQQTDGSTQWLYSSGGAASYTNLITTTVPYSELQFGDFDGDGKTDVLAALPQNDGSLQVVYWLHGQGSAVALGNIPAPAPALRVGDFNGDGISDLLALRCGMQGPLAFGPLQTLATSGYSTFNRTLAGDVNGDGRPDVILVSTCQNPSSFGTCATHYLQVGAALGTLTQTDTLVAPQTLSTDSFEYWKVLAGDFDGDGKTDLALVYPSGSSLTIEVAHSNGDGTFTLGAPQVFGSETWGSFNPVVGDFNGDGKADLAFATVCHFADSSCSDGDNNSVYVALSTGTGTFNMGARHDLGAATGWEDYYAVVGDFNGDGKADLVFNSTCQKTNFIDSTCTIGDANYVYTALSNGSGGFALSAKQTYGSSGWADYAQDSDLVGDVNGDGRSDLIWSSGYQSVAKTNNNLVVAGFANPDGTFQLGSNQNFGSTWTGRLSLAKLNHDGKADLVWSKAPSGDTDVATYAAATSNGDGTFKNLGPGSVYTGQGSFRLLDNGDLSQPATGLTLVSTKQDSISTALFVVNGFWPGEKVYLPLVLR